MNATALTVNLCCVPESRMRLKTVFPLAGQWLRWLDCPICDSTKTVEIDPKDLDAAAVLAATDWWLGWKPSINRVVLDCEVDGPQRCCSLYSGQKLRGFGQAADPIEAMRIALEMAT